MFRTIYFLVVLLVLSLSGCMPRDPGIPISMGHFQQLYAEGHITQLTYTEDWVILTLTKEASQEYRPAFEKAIQQGAIRSMDEAIFLLKVADLSHLKREIAEVRRTNPGVKEVPLRVVATR
ncbi:hypothetical protein QNI16_05475 [Cytophagaceae bacterium YF14B1]|uniref:Uncharacterized protein n=1 Tax=Xanthocytophaga flava TaxID=3048013 RepID=A0AAE3U5V7_9BACT|nr:hypothetical protein [Xanthocytophaga flavus]MDJ1479927.1 hypothetical protein [Xanthocytophaga flavus]